VPRSLARQWGISEGDLLELITLAPAPATHLVIHPRTKRLEARVAIVTYFHSFYDRNSVFMSLKDLQLFMNRSGEFAEITRISLKCRDMLQIKPLARRLSRKFSSLRDESGFFGLRIPFQDDSWIQQAYSEMTLVRLIVAFVIFLAACALFLMIHLLMKGKIKTLGLLMAMGVSPFRLFSMVMSYGFLLSVVGAGLGWICGRIFMAYIDPLHEWLVVGLMGMENGLFGIYGFESFPSAYSHSLGLFVSFCSVVLCVFSALLPAWSVSRLRAAEVLKMESS
jgi:ABC-type lipoprotein release transport system permease subunit